MYAWKWVLLIFINVIYTCWFSKNWVGVVSNSQLAPISGNVINQILYLEIPNSNSRHVDKCCTAGLDTSKIWFLCCCTIYCKKISTTGQGELDPWTDHFFSSFFLLEKTSPWPPFFYCYTPQLSLSLKFSRLWERCCRGMGRVDFCPKLELPISMSIKWIVKT